MFVCCCLFDCLLFRCYFDFYGNSVDYGRFFVLMLVLFDLFAFDVPFHGLLLNLVLFVWVCWCLIFCLLFGFKLRFAMLIVL